MSREVRRVPLDFAWPLNETWGGYLMPRELCAGSCGACGGNGHSERGQQLNDQWYGNAPFKPEDNGSTPLTWDTPVVYDHAKRNVERNPEFYGVEEMEIRREACRLAAYWNRCWANHLNAEDVAALIEGDRLWDFTRDYVQGAGWVPKDPMPVVTPEMVNEWEIRGMGHDGINSWVVLKARCVREGVAPECGSCGGSGAAWRDDDHKAANEAWERVDPPTGDGWQVWETVSDGSPVSPVFATAEELIAHLQEPGQVATRERPLSEAAARAFVGDGWAPSAISIPGHGTMDGPAAAEFLAGVSE